MIFQRLVTLFTDPELRDNRQVNKGERHQRTEVNQRRCHHQVKVNRQKRDRTDQDNVHRRGTPGWMHVAEEAFREYAIAAHYVHQTRNACMRGHTGRQYGDGGEDQRADLERFTRHVQHNFRLRRIRILEARDIREVQLQEIGRENKDQTANQRRQEDGTRNYALCIFGFFRQVADPVKTGKGEAQNGCPGNHRDHMRITRPERLAARQGARAFAVEYAVNHHAKNNRNQDNLKHNDNGVKVGDRLDAAQVKGRHKGHQRHDEHPRGNRRHQRFKIDFCQQNVDHRREQIVEQRRPAHHKANRRADGFLGIGVGGTRRRIATHQFTVAQRGKEDRNQREAICRWHMTVCEA